MKENKIEQTSRGNPYPAALPMLMFASLTHGAGLRSGIPHWGRSVKIISRCHQNEEPNVCLLWRR